MPEAVIVATARSPIGRAMKGSLVDLRPDDMATQMVTAVLDQVPDLPAGWTEDGPEAGRDVASALLEPVPGVADPPDPQAQLPPMAVRLAGLPLAVLLLLAGVLVLAVTAYLAWG